MDYLQEWVADAMDVMLWRIARHNQVLQHPDQIWHKL